MEAEELRTTAALAMLELGEEELAGLKEAAAVMLEYFSLMQQVDIEGLEPTTHTLDGTTALRGDGDSEGSRIPVEKLLQEAPERDGSCFVIPNVL